MNNHPGGGKYCNSLVIHSFQKPGGTEGKDVQSLHNKLKTWEPDKSTGTRPWRIEYRIEVHDHPYTREAHLDPNVTPSGETTCCTLYLFRNLDTTKSRSWISLYVCQACSEEGEDRNIDVTVKDDLTKEEALRAYRRIKNTAEKAVGLSALTAVTR